MGWTREGMEERRSAAELAEVDFFAENELVGIQPTRRTAEALDLASVYVDRFRMYERREVPLWLGLALERKGQATVERPEWLSVETLTAKIAEERKLKMDALGELPEYFESIAAKLVGAEEPANVLVQDLITIRRSKILNTIKTIDIRFVHANVKTWTAMERTMYRVGAIALLDRINQLVGHADSTAHSSFSVSQHSG